MSSPQVATGDRIIDPMIALAGCSTHQRIVVAGSKSMELMLELHRRGYLLAAAAGNCGLPTGQYDVALVDWRRRTLHTLETTMDWLVNFLSSLALHWWFGLTHRSQQRTKAFAPRWRNAASSSCTAPCMNAVARFWRDDRRPIRSKRRRSAPSGDRNSCTMRVSSDQEGSVGSSKGNPNGQAEGTTRHHSRVDGTCARETTIRPAGTSFCKIRGPTTQPATRPPSAARRDHGMAAATHGTTLI